MQQHRAAVDTMFSLAYEELRRLAASIHRDHSAVTLTPTALLHEAWLKLSASSSFDPASRIHFQRVAARAMRQVLVDAARRRNAAKRGAGAVLVTLDDERSDGTGTTEDVLRIDAALEELARVSPRQAALVEHRFFGGFDVAETAEMLDVSEATVMRDWRCAKAWLAVRLKAGSRERAALGETP